MFILSRERRCIAAARRAGARALGASLALWLAGCGHTTSQTAQPSQPAAQSSQPAEPARPASRRNLTAVPKPPPSAAIGDVMADHFMITSWARDVVIAGQIDPLREPLFVLAEYRYDDIKLGGWMPWIAELQTAARLTAGAESLDAAAMGVATMTRICGECHVAGGAGPKLSENVPRVEPPEYEDLAGRMFRHMWAANLLWQGLTVPSDASWEEGVRELKASPEQLDHELPPEFDADLAQVAALASQAGEATTLAQRADVYGLLLATCAGCHVRWLDDEPGH